jgi:murein DD-endopeptidase MepM/ murein hydrolase activator NlpD
MARIDWSPARVWLRKAGSPMRRAARRALPVALGLAVLLFAAVFARDAYSQARLSGYRPGHDGSAPLTPGGAPAPAAQSAGAASQAAPSGVDAARPFGPPVARADWLVTRDYAAHGGRSDTGAIDIGFVNDYRALGAAIVATHAGRVKLLRDDPTFGNLVYVLGARFSTTYGHMGKFYVKDGDQVARGTVLGEMGATGKTPGPRLDYQVWQDGVNQNPMDYGITAAQGTAGR